MIDTLVFTYLFPGLLLLLPVIVTLPNKKKIKEVLSDRRVFVLHHTVFILCLLLFLVFIAYKFRMKIENIFGYLGVLLAMVQMIIYGNRLIVSTEGITYSGKVYSWDEIDRIEITSDEKIEIVSNSRFFGGFKLWRYQYLSEFEMLAKGKTKIIYK